MTEDITIIDKFYRVPAKWLINKIFIKTKITPNMITFMSFLFAIAAAALFAFGTYVFAIIALVLFEISLFLDYIDGSLARITKQTSIFGDWLDRTLDSLKEAFLFLGICYGLFLQSQQYLMLLLGLGCICVGLFRDLIVHTAGYCYKDTQVKLRKKYEKKAGYKLLKYVESLFLIFIIVAVFFKILHIYLWTFLIFYALYNLVRILYSIKVYKKLGK